jgi:hypothetical protein
MARLLVSAFWIACSSVNTSASSSADAKITANHLNPFMKVRVMVNQTRRAPSLRKEARGGNPRDDGEPDATNRGKDILPGFGRAISPTLSRSVLFNTPKPDSNRPNFCDDKQKVEASERQSFTSGILIRSDRPCAVH